MYLLLANPGFRLNKYCGEHLVIANESPALDPTPPTHQLRSINNKRKSLTSNTLELADDDAEVFDEPIAEALIQNEQTFHHLKILKSSPAEDAYERQMAGAAEAKLNRQSQRKKVYSQVRILHRNIEYISSDFNFSLSNRSYNLRMEHILGWTWLQVSVNDIAVFENSELLVETVEFAYVSRYGFSTEFLYSLSNSYSCRKRFG